LAWGTLHIFWISVETKYLTLCIFTRTWRLPRNLVEEVIANALRVGYRSFDCAALYNNERQVGRALHTFLASQAALDKDAQLHPVPRQDLFIASKLWNTHHRKDMVTEACRETLKVYLLIIWQKFNSMSASFLV